MKKVLLIIIIILAAAVAGGWFWQSQNPDRQLFNFSFGTSEPPAEPLPPEEPLEPKFYNLGPAPELTGLNRWLNSEEPVTLSDLQDRVVLVHFWTHSCISCINALPYLNKWHNEYQAQGLTVIGIHTPEFAFEKVVSNVEAAVKRYQLTYPIALDNDYRAWRAFQNQFWPAVYLIDKNHDIVYTHFGDGNYQQTEQAIRILLGMEGDFTAPPAEARNPEQTPDIHLGLLRLNNFGGSEQKTNSEQIFVFPRRLAKHRFALEGQWRFEQEAVAHTTGFGRIRLNFNAAQVFMVAQSKEPVTLKIFVDGELQKGVTVGESNLYPLFEAATPAERIMEIEFPRPGAQVFTFTFN